MCYQVHDHVASLQFTCCCISEIPATKMLYLTAWTYFVTYNVTMAKCAQLVHLTQ